MRLLAVLLLLLSTACAKPQASVATLVDLDGTVESQRADPVAAWSGAARGERYRIGDAIRTAPDATARLRLAGNGTLDLDPDTLVRFQRTPGQGLDIGVEAGAVEIEAGDTELVLETEIGEARISARGRARVTAANQGETRLEVLVGTVVLEGEDGPRTLTTGAQVEIAMGGAVLEDDPPSRDAAVPASPDAAVAAAVAVAAPDAGTDAPVGPAQVDIVVRAGESAVLHDPQPPTAVGMRIDCAEVGQLEVAGKKGWKQAAVTTGRGGVSAWLDAGAHRYRVRCGDQVEASGKIVVKRDAARKQLPSRPPRNVVDADGRRYTVLYQNRLPELVLRWSDAPAGKRYILHVVSAGKDRAFEVDAARYTFGSGKLGEGEHRWWFEVDGQRSAETTVAIDFDNAAATVYLRQVEIGADTVRVDGAAVPDSVVSLEGAAVDLDAQQRFTASGPIKSGRRTLALRIAHPAGGVHYYVLRGD